MTNGSNSWGVPFSHISWFERLLNNHKNIESVLRTKDIYFTVKRKTQGDILQILCVREYTFGHTMTERALAEFGEINIIYIGGGWNGYTPEAKEYCLHAHIGLYVTDEMSGALWNESYWAYHQKDRDGNPSYFYRTA